MTTERRRSEKYLGAPYVRDNSPWVLLDRDRNHVESGINCQTFAHLYYKDEFGVSLPVGMWSKEFYEDDGLIFRPVDNDEEMLRGDILLVGKGKTIPKNLHVAVVHRVDQGWQGASIIRHANKRDGVVSDWTLDEIREHSEYPVVRGIRRMVDDLHAIQIRPYLNE